MYFDIKACGNRIKALREKAGITQEQLANQLHIGYSHLSKIEVGTRTPSIDVLLELSDFFDVSLDWLVIGNVDDGKCIKRKIRRVINQLNEIEQGLSEC